jgi:hypothetical protein
MTKLTFFTALTIALSASSALAGGAELHADCHRLSAHAKAYGVRTLVIGFEGLASFSASASRAAYDYQFNLAQGQKSKAPSGGMGGFVARGLMVPTVAAYGKHFELMMYPYTATGEANACALSWMKVPGRRLIITGHSFGGHAAVRLTEALAARNVRPDTVITIDARSVLGTGIHRSRNARRWENFYQFGGGLPGKSIPEADVNQRLRAGHTGMPFQPEVRKALLEAVRR